MALEIVETLFRGICVGVAASITVGPVAVLCIQRTLSKSRRSGIVSGIGVACADTFMAMAALFFYSMLQTQIEQYNTLLRVIGGIFVVIVGVFIFAQNPDAKKIGLLYDVGQDSSTAAIEHAKAYLDDKGVEYVERTATTAEEVALAAQALVSDGVDAVFTPTDNTIMKAELAIYETFADAGIPHYTGADSFALNGAFLGYGVDYANLGRETADMIASILTEGKDPATTPVITFDNGTATVNTEICEKLGLDFDTVSEAFAPYCTRVEEITTAESFSDLES